MLLTIDAGNTNIVFAVYSLTGSKQEKIEQCRLETRLADEGQVPVVINEIAQKYPDIQGAIISSVVPKVNDILEKSCEYLLKTTPIFVTNENAGIEIKTQSPEQIGADRLVAAVAVNAYYKRPAIIVDFGTATTFDVVEAGGAYCGGVIAPGINLSLLALHQAAAKLPEIQVAKPKNVVGKNTVEAMQSGIYWGYIGLIEGTIKRIADEMQMENPFVIATGGLAPLFDSGTQMIEQIDGDLIMKGLVHIYIQQSENKNRKSA